MAGAHSLIDTTDALAKLMDKIANLPTNPPSLYLDLEGVNLSRTGSVSILQLFVVPEGHVYLIDIHVLNSVAFTTAGTAGKKFKHILEDPAIPKVFFDVRKDSDALHHHYGIALQGIEDIQLMENASRPSGRRRTVNGLARCIRDEAPLTFQQKQTWITIKEEGARMFAPEKGGSYEVFNARPLNQTILAYCVQDVRLLPSLREIYWARLDAFWKGKVEHETKERVRASQSANYQSHGAFGPWQ